MTTPARFHHLLSFLAIIAVGVANWFVFMVVPNERVMGAVQRVFYFHVASAFACYGAFAAVFFASCVYLASRSVKADQICRAAGEVGFVFCTIVLATGMIWGHSAWNTWFRWEEPRLVSFLVLWLIFLSFTILRNFGDPSKSAAHGAILGILGAVSVPLVIFSIKLLPQSARLHPEVVEHGGLRDPSYWQAFGLSIGALLLLTGLLIWIRYRIAAAEDELRMRRVDEEIYDT